MPRRDLRNPGLRSRRCDVRAALPCVIGLLALVPSVARAADGTLDHVHLNVTNGDVAAQWYIGFLGCKAVPGHGDVAQCGDMRILFVNKPPRGGNDGTAADHVSFGVADMTTTMERLLKAGVSGGGVRVMDRESPIHDVPGVGKVAYVKDPWGTKLEIIEDARRTGVHHVHLFSADPTATTAWYQRAFGGTPGMLTPSLGGLQYGTTWLIVTAPNPDSPSPLQPTAGRTIDHVGFSVANLDGTVADARESGVQVRREPGAKSAMLSAPDGVTIEVISK